MDRRLWWTVPALSDLDFRSSLRVGRPEEMAGATARSYLPDGRCVGWFAPFGGTWVVDAECAGRPVPTALGNRFGVEDFWTRWTRVECATKLSGAPILTWLHTNGLAIPEDDSVAILTVRADWLAPDLIVSVGWTHVA